MPLFTNIKVKKEDTRIINNIFIYDTGNIYLSQYNVTGTFIEQLNQSLVNNLFAPSSILNECIIKITKEEYESVIGTEFIMPQ